MIVQPTDGSPGPSRRVQLELPTPTKRSAEQSRVLDMVERAARAKGAIENLDLEGVLVFMRHIEELRSAATANLQAKAEEARRARREKREGKV